MNNFSETANFIRSVAELIQGPYWPNHCKVVMLPVTVLRWPDCVLEPTRAKVLDRQKELAGGKVKNVEPILCRVSNVLFYNTSRFTSEMLKGDARSVSPGSDSVTSRVRAKKKGGVSDGFETPPSFVAHRFLECKGHPLICGDSIAS